MKPVTLLAIGHNPRYTFILELYMDKLKALDIPFNLVLGKDCIDLLSNDALNPDVEYLFFGSSNINLSLIKEGVIYYLSSLGTSVNKELPVNVKSFYRKEYLQEVCKAESLDYKPYKDLVEVLNDVKLTRALSSLLGLTYKTFFESFAFLQAGKVIELDKVKETAKVIFNHTLLEIHEAVTLRSRVTSLHGVDISWCNLTQLMAMDFNTAVPKPKPLSATRYPLDRTRDVLTVYLNPKDERSAAENAMVEYLKRIGSAAYVNRVVIIIDANTDLSSL